MPDVDGRSIHESPWYSFLCDEVHVNNDEHISYRGLIEDAAAQPGQFIGLTIYFPDVVRWASQLLISGRASHDLADDIIRNPERVIAELESILSEMRPLGEGRQMRVHFVGVTEDAYVEIRDIRQEHADRLVSVRGIVQMTSEARPRMIAAAFRCQRCACVTVVPQHDHMVLLKPAVCDEDQGGCGRESKKGSGFEFIPTLARVGVAGTQSVDMQVFKLQERPEDVEGTNQPQQINVFVYGALCNVVMPSERVRINGILKCLPRRVQGRETAMLDYFLQAVGIEKEELTYDDITWTPAQEREIIELSQNPRIIPMIVNSIAPSIDGRQDVKLGLALQQFGGVKKQLADGTTRRGEINLLMIGDSGEGKTKLGDAATKIAPRGRSVNAATATKAGILGGAERSDKGFGFQTWQYAAGDASHAHGGVFFLDEVDKSKDEDTPRAIGEPMAEGRITLSAMGAHGVRLPCEAGWILGANPTSGYLDEDVSVPLKEQTKLPPHIWDRLDLIFAIRATVDREQDARRSAMILSAARAGGLAAASAVRTLSPEEERALHGARLDQTPDIAPDVLKRYIAYARQRIVPVLTPEVDAKITEGFHTVRARKGGVRAMGNRQLEAVIRCAEAAARARLSHLVELQDLKHALNIMEWGWDRHARKADGTLDMGQITSSLPTDQLGLIRWMQQLVHELTKDQPDGVPGDEIIREAIKRGVPRERALAAFNWLREQTSKIMQTPLGGWKLTTPQRS